MNTGTSLQYNPARTTQHPNNQEHSPMAFVNELITDEDRQKFGLDELDNSQSMRGATPQRDWTIDHERGIYLRLIGTNNRELADFDNGERRPKNTWHFYWQGELMTVCIERVDGGSDGIRGSLGHGWAHHQLIACYNQSFFIPASC